MRNLFLGIFFLLFFSSALAYVIEGDKVYYENEFARLTVYPHTVKDPTTKHRQFFLLENKKDELYQDVQLGYFFGVQPTGDIFRFIDSESAVVRKDVKALDMANYDWNYVANGKPLNPYYVQIFHFDSNAPTKPIIDWNGDIADSNLVGGLRHFFIDYNLPSASEWQSIKNKFNFYGLTDFGYFYYSDKFDVQPSKKYLWELVYQTNVPSGKWALVAFKGDSPDCIFSDSCNKLWIIDPWYDQDYVYRRPLTIQNNSPYLLQDTNVPIKVSLNNQLGANALMSCWDVRIVHDYNGVQTEIDRNAYGNCQTDANIYFDLYYPINPYQSDSNYWIYYGNAGASSPTSAILVNGSLDSKSLTYCPADSNTGQYSPNLAGTGLNNNCATAGAMAQVEGAGVKGEKGIVRTSSAIGWFDGNFIPKTDTALTYEFWFYLNSSVKQRFAGFSVNTPADNVQFIIEDSPAPVSHLRVVAIQDGVILHDLDSRVVPTFSQWHHVAYTCGALGAKLYLDWNLISSSANVQCVNQSPSFASFTLGTPNGVATEYSTSGAKFDELRISNYQRQFVPQKDLNSSTVQPSTSFGAEEILAFDYSPLVDINYPNGGEAINIGANPLVDLKVRIINDQNWALLDLNYSLLGIVGTGTVIAKDLNTAESPFVSCDPDYNDDNVGSLCVYSWDASLVADGNYFLIASVSDDSGERNWDVSDADFNFFSIFPPPFDVNNTYSRYFSADDPRRDNVYAVDGFESFSFIFMVLGVILISGVAILILRG